MNNVESIIEADNSDISSKQANKSPFLSLCGDIHFKPFSEIHVAVNKCYIFQNLYIFRMSTIFIPVS